MPLYVVFFWRLQRVMSQMSKRELDNKMGAKGAEEGTTGGYPSLAGLRAAAAEAAVHGDADQSRFRDAECFVPTSREGRLEEEGFSVHRGGVDAMSGAVMDLMDDETVRLSSTATPGGAHHHSKECASTAHLHSHRPHTSVSSPRPYTPLMLVQAGLAAQQRRFHWDKRRRQYVQLQPNEHVQAGKRKRTESGKQRAKDGDKPTGIYNKWVRSSKLRVPAAGELTEGGEADTAHLADRYASSLMQPDSA